jgi:hypothetical protein
MTLDNAKPEIEGYEPPKVWDIGELTELTEHKTSHVADFNGLEPPNQAFSY